VRVRRVPEHGTDVVEDVALASSRGTRGRQDEAEVVERRDGQRIGKLELRRRDQHRFLLTQQHRRQARSRLAIDQAELDLACFGDDVYGRGNNGS
jgi:hypothetical protein